MSTDGTAQAEFVPPSWDTKMPLPSNPETGEDANDYYTIDCEVHVMPEDYRRYIKYFEGTKTFEYAHKMCNQCSGSTTGTTGSRPCTPGMDWHIDKIIADMDRSGVDQIALMRESFIDTAGDRRAVFHEPARHRRHREIPRPRHRRLERGAVLQAQDQGFPLGDGIPPRQLQLQVHQVLSTRRLPH